MTSSKVTIIGIITTVCLMLGCTGRKHAEMQDRLHQLNAFNRADSIFRSTDEAQALVDYFEDHGTPNEQMLAYYLLGRAYHDLHEAPMALKYFQIASERADTTAANCDYRQLSRVYGQMSSIFYQQNLMRQSLEKANLSELYGWKGMDTLNALRSKGGKIFAYKRLSEPDSAIYISEELYKKYKDSDYKEYAASYLASVIRDLIDRGEYGKAKTYMNNYESLSGFFDSTQNISRGREIYYYSKGYYYFKTNKLDSAEYFFRKELREGKDFNNQNAGSRGLTLLYQKTHKPDSAAKYALYSYEMNDSVYAQMATSEVERLQAMYDYSRNQMLAEQAKDKADKARARAQLITIALFLFVIASAFVAREVYKKRRIERAQYKANVSLLAKTQADVVKLRSYGSELSQLLADKEKDSARLTAEIEKYKERVGQQKVSADALLEESEIYEYLQKSADKALVLSDDDWHQTYMMLIEILPNFYRLISSKRSELNDNEFKTSILIRLHFTPKDVANMLNVTQPYITKVCKSLMQKLFDEEGKSKELSEKLKQYS
jgi:hypothetical protein